jgi:DNA-binding NarL/FixJ family response regulator
LLECENRWEVCGEAADGDEAVERSRTLHPDVVVMDAVMPRRNGFDATREIVRNSPEIPVVITTLLNILKFCARRRSPVPSGALVNQRRPGC